MHHRLLLLMRALMAWALLCFAAVPRPGSECACLGVEPAPRVATLVSAHMHNGTSSRMLITGSTLIHVSGGGGHCLCVTRMEASMECLFGSL